jgi:hypothetical protein
MHRGPGAVAVFAFRVDLQRQQLEVDVEDSHLPATHLDHDGLSGLYVGTRSASFPADPPSPLGAHSRVSGAIQGTQTPYRPHAKRYVPPASAVHRGIMPESPPERGSG